jgi:hypothetical protein
LYLSNLKTFTHNLEDEEVLKPASKQIEKEVENSSEYDFRSQYNITIDNILTIPAKSRVKSLLLLISVGLLS